MTKEELWLEINRQNPRFQTEGANLKPNGLRKMFDLIWDVAYKEGVNPDGSDDGINEPFPAAKNASCPDLFKQIFGDISKK